MTTPIALTIAGSDSSGGAGIQADLKTFAALEVYGASVLTALTAQNTLGVQGVLVTPPDFIGQQIDSVFSDLMVGAVKTGMLGDSATIAAVVAGLARHRRCPLVVDPVMVATSGDALIADTAVAHAIAELIPRADLITPNLPEAARLLSEAVADSETAMQRQAEKLFKLGCGAVLIKGGHAAGDSAVDIFFDGQEMRRLSSPRLATRHTHGTGCTLSAAIAAGLAKGLPLVQAVTLGKGFVTAAIAAADGLGIGQGHGPVSHVSGGAWFRMAGQHSPDP
jgi:hydroxymethylpyrimidine/phosphomethylpyrimidine kinase